MCVVMMKRKTVAAAIAVAGRTVGVELSDHLLLGDRPMFTSLREWQGAIGSK